MATNTDTDTVRVERVDGVARVVLDRPDRHNAMNVEMADALRTTLFDAVDDRGVRAVVVAGTGPAFHTGADLDAMTGDRSDSRRFRAIATRLHSAVATVATANVPTVTAVNGVAAGGGLGLALSGDLVFVHEDARFEFAYPRIGLSGDGGSTWFLPRLLGHRRAREFAFLDEPIGPEEAVETGLATEALADGEFEDRVATVAADLADGPTRAYAATKRLLGRSYERDLREQLAAETDRITRLATTTDYARGLAAFGTDDDPEFEGR